MKLLLVSINPPYPPLNADSLFVYNVIREINCPETIVILSCTNNIDENNLSEISQYSSHVKCINISKYLHLNNILKGLFSAAPLSLKRYDFYQLEQEIRIICKSHRIDRMIFVDPNLIQMGYRLKDIEIPKIYHAIDSVRNYLTIKSQFENNITKKYYSISQAKKWENLYKSFLIHFDKVITVTEEEKEDFKKFLDRKLIEKICVIPHGIDTNYFNPNNVSVLKEFPSLIFHGNMIGESEFSIKFFVNIFISLKNQIPNLKWYIVGRIFSKNIINLVRDIEGIVLTDYVEDIRIYLKKATIGVYPMFGGTGIKDRVLESMAMGLPTITTERGSHGINIQHMENGLIADKEDEYYEYIIDLIENENLRRMISIKAQEYINMNHKWSSILSSLINIL